MRHKIVIFLLASLSAAAQLGSPPGLHRVFDFQTQPSSVQIYTCKAGPAEAYIWAGPDPDAILLSRDKTVTVHHYQGPTWESFDGSIIKGSNAKHFKSTRHKAVDWLELTAIEGTQNFGKVTLIHRIDTAGGTPPDPASHPCDSTHSGEQIRVPYSATYEFYAP